MNTSANYTHTLAYQQAWLNLLAQTCSSASSLNLQNDLKNQQDAKRAMKFEFHALPFNI